MNWSAPTYNLNKEPGFLPAARIDHRVCSVFPVPCDSPSPCFDNHPCQQRGIWHPRCPGWIWSRQITATLRKGYSIKIAEQLDTLLQSKVSHEFTLQLICVKHNQVGNDIEAFTSQFAKSEFENLSLLGDNLKAFYQKAAIHGFKTNTMLSPRLTHTDCYIVIDKIKKESESDLKACFGQFRVSFEASLSAAKIGFKELMNLGVFMKQPYQF